MKILMAHNFYQQPGGEDRVFAAEKALLRQGGHTVVEYTESNARIASLPHLDFLKESVWSTKSFEAVLKIIDEVKPDVAHFHNTFPLISPSAYYACRRRGVVVVQTLHNSRLICPAARLFRRGKYCEDCLTFPGAVPGIFHRCYHDSGLHTGVAAFIYRFHRFIGTWNKAVDGYIVFSEFYRRKFIRWGLPPEKVFIKPHFVAPDPRPRENGPGDYILFVGRMSPDKGVRTLIRAWPGVRDFSLKIVGNGNDFSEIGSMIKTQNFRGIELLGEKNKDDVFRLMKGARAVVVPSEVAETFGLVAVEAFACGTPVLAADIGALSEVVTDGVNGRLFIPGDHADLREKILWMMRHPREADSMGTAARKIFEARYGASSNLRRLEDIYEALLKIRKERENL